VEAKEHVKVKEATQTFATITLQNSPASVEAVPVIPASLWYMRK